MSSYAAFLRFAQLALIALLIRLRSDAVKNRRPLLPVFIPLRLPGPLLFPRKAAIALSRRSRSA